jgi:diaminohydroxyphosphoribosylaminopyrimidine deaminase/5-amino-6-(5-phosphoribosylamino)uracil reductase
VIPVAVNERGQLDLVVAMTLLARKGLMHVLVEGGSGVLGSAFDQRLIDHAAVFIAPKLVGGDTAPTPLGGRGVASMQEALHLQQVKTQSIGGDILVEGEGMYTPTS